MTDNLANIKILGWDIDNTLYKRSITLEKELKRIRNLWLAEKLKIDIYKVEKIIEAEYINTKSYADAFTKITGLDHRIYQSIFTGIDKRKHLRKDPKLIAVFKRLSRFRHFIITNSSKKHSLESLEALGLSPDIFETILAAEETNQYKPDPSLFKKMLEITRLPPDRHLYIGDHEQLDILPAKSLGIKTAITWKKSFLADVCLKNIYEIVKIL